MECPGVRQEEVVERYLRGLLGPQERESFEEHYFACDQCFADLQAHRALQAELASSAPRIRATPVSVPSRPRWKFALAAAAVLVLGVLGTLRALRQVSSPAALVQSSKPAPSGPSLSDLARFDPPAYTPAILRGPQSDATREFRTAMARYQSHDYAAAIPRLRAAAKLNPRDPGTTFFLGVSLLLTNQADDGIAALQQTIALGDTPFLEEAHYYLAEAFLRKGDVAAARRELDEVLRLKGDQENQARQLLQQLAALGKDSQ